MAIISNDTHHQFYHPATASTEGAVGGVPKLVLRLEALAVLALAVAGYARLGGTWWFFAALFLTPDLSMLGYLGGRRLGAMLYNAGHCYLAPAVLGAVGVLTPSALVLQLALIWAAHIGFDRMIGYGLKYATGFRHTHLGPTRQSR
jgi:hypothetical protein